MSLQLKILYCFLICKNIKNIPNKQVFCCVELFKHPVYSSILKHAEKNFILLMTNEVRLRKSPCILKLKHLKCLIKRYFVTKLNK